MIVTAKGRPIDNQIHVGGTGRACTSILPSMMTACQTYKGTREGSRRAGSQLANYQTDEGHDAARRYFSIGKKLSGLAASPVARASGSSPREHS